MPRFIEPGLVELSFVIDSLEGASIAPKPLDLTGSDSGSASILDGVARIGNGTIDEERSNNVVGITSSTSVDGIKVISIGKRNLEFSIDRLPSSSVKGSDLIDNTIGDFSTM